MSNYIQVCYNTGFIVVIIPCFYEALYRNNTVGFVLFCLLDLTCIINLCSLFYSF